MRQGLRPVRPVLLFCLLVASLAATAWAGPRDHDGGFFLRLSGGYGTVTTLHDIGETDQEVSARTADVNVAIGGMVTPNLAIHGTLFGWSWFTPHPEISLYGSSETLVSNVSLESIGVGLTYYIMPINTYISGSIGAAGLTFDKGYTRGETDMGPAIDLTMGKEWWVSDSWGLGVAAGFGYHSVPERGEEGDWTGWSLGIRFTSSYN
jgi:hypothetical protein